MKLSEIIQIIDEWRHEDECHRKITFMTMNKTKGRLDPNYVHKLVVMVYAWNYSGDLPFEERNLI